MLVRKKLLRDLPEPRTGFRSIFHPDKPCQRKQEPCELRGNAVRPPPLRVRFDGEANTLFATIEERPIIRHGECPEKECPRICLIVHVVEHDRGVVIVLPTIFRKRRLIVARLLVTGRSEEAKVCEDS